MLVNYIYVYIRITTIQEKFYSVLNEPIDSIKELSYYFVENELENIYYT